MFIGGMDMRLRGYQTGVVGPSPLIGFFDHFWKLDDLTDAIGSSTLTNTNSVTFAPGKIGNAANFVAASLQDLRTQITIIPNGDRTIALWVKPTAAGLATQHGFFSVNEASLPTGGAPLLILGVSHTANKLYLYQGGAYHEGSTVLSADTYYNIVYTFNHTGSVNNVYLNGSQEIGPFAQTDGNTVNNKTIYIGSGFSTQFDGAVDACGLDTGHVASAAQISAIFNGGVGVEPPF